MTVMSELEAERHELIGRLAVIESTLLQREEEIEQTRDELTHISGLLKQREEWAADRQLALDVANRDLSIVQDKLQEANDWVFKLAGERQAAQADAVSLRRQLETQSVDRLRAERKLAQIENVLAGIIAEKANLLAQLKSSSRQVQAARDDLQRVERDAGTLRQSHAEHIDNLQQDHSIAFAGVMMRLGDAHDQIENLQEQVFEQARELSMLTNLLLDAENSLSQTQADQAFVAENNILLTRDLEVLNVTVQEAQDAYRRAKDENEALLRAHAAQIATLEQEHADAFAEVMERLKDANHRYQTLEVRAGEQTRELASLSLLLLGAETSRDYKAEVLLWLVQVQAETRNIPIWWHFIPSPWKMRRINDRLLARGLFDGQAYLALYPDVAAANADPLRHFLNHGALEGRTLTR